MRIKNSLLNSAFGLLQQGIAMILSLVNRWGFVQFLSLEFLGYTGLFSNILMWLNFVDAGFSSVIVYRLYKSMGGGDKTETLRLLAIYRKLTFGMAVVVAAAGLLLTGLTPMLTSQVDIDLLLYFEIYWIQLAVAVVSYIGSYARAYFLINQQDYVATNVDSIVKILVQVTQLATMAIFRNLLLYLIIALVGNILANVIIMHLAKKREPGLRVKGRVTLRDVKDANILTEAKEFVLQKLGLLIFGGTDSVIIARVMGILDVAKYGNYLALYQTTSAFLFGKIIDGVQAAIGNYVYKEDDEKQADMFSMLDIITFIWSSVISCGYLVCFQPAMALWLGEDVLLPFAFVAALVATQYINQSTEILAKYRKTLGNYKQDRNWVFLGALLNLVLSISLIFPFGLVGVQIGTAIGTLFISVGRLKVVASSIPGIGLRQYLFRHLRWTLIWAFQCVAVYLLTMMIPVTIWGLLLRGVVACLFSALASIVLFHKNRAFQQAFALVKRIVTKGRGKHDG